MLPELGQFALILALLLALAQGIVPLIGGRGDNPRYLRFAYTTTAGQFAFVLLSFAILTTAFVIQDFSVAYVAQNSNSLLPIHYRFSAVWGAHEGSLLLWALILTVWTVAFAIGSRKLPLGYSARTLSILGLIAAGFYSFILFTSNPFLRHVPALADGNDLNPLLQDPGLIIHPPMLYTGYVGFAVSFAMACAALMVPGGEKRWARWARPWTLVAWAFLTVGIGLGSYWAYYELGWGGWWFWDPVENASFMPWLVGVALLHSLAMTERRGVFASWSILLAIAAFSLSLLGTFLVRSGILTSVHAFASDPERGMFILAFLGVVVGGALTLYAMRARNLVGLGKAETISREGFVAANNLFFIASTAMILWGTLYPLLVTVSVGPPYFNLLFGLLMGPALLLLPLAVLSRYQKDDAGRIVRAALPALVALPIAAVAVWFLPEPSMIAAMAIALGAWVIVGSILGIRTRLRRAVIDTRFIGMTVAHISVGVFVIGAVLAETQSLEKDVRMSAGESAEIRGWTFQFEGTRRVDGPNYQADEGLFRVYRDDGELYTVLRPQKRLYSRGGSIMTEAAIERGFWRDLYVSLGEPLDEQGSAWAVRLYHKPMVRWIWVSVLGIMIGGFITATHRWRARRETTSSVVSQTA